MQRSGRGELPAARRIPYFANNVPGKSSMPATRRRGADRLRRDARMRGPFPGQLPGGHLDGRGHPPPVRRDEAFGPAAITTRTFGAVVGVRDHAHCTSKRWTKPRKPGEVSPGRNLPASTATTCTGRTGPSGKRPSRISQIHPIYHLHELPPSKKYGLRARAQATHDRGTDFAVEEMEANLLGIRQLSIAMRRSPERWTLHRGLGREADPAAD